MLGKLLKYDMRSLRRILLPLVLGAPAVALLCAMALRLTIALSIAESQNPAFIALTMTTSLFVTVSIIAVIASPVVAVIFIMMHFYRSLYSDEGYLTFTLPLKTHDILNSKIISGVVWVVISSVSFLASGAIIVMLGTTTDTLLNTGVLQVLSELAKEMLFGAPASAYAVIMCVNAVSSQVFLITTLALSITIGSIISKKHKALSGVAIYYLLNSASSFLSGTVSFLFTLAAFNGSENFAALTYTTMSAPLVGIIFNFGLSAAAYIACCYLMKNRLNLE